MIARIWHGFTTPENADAYERLLQTQILPGIEREHNSKTQFFRREIPKQNEVEFITICYFDSIDEIRSFAGEDYERCVVIPEARKLLKRFDERSQHFEVKRQLAK